MIFSSLLFIFFLEIYSTNLLDEIENSSKPIIAAIENSCTGFGLEIILSCHYRIAHCNARFSFPEINMGMIPMYNGAQRLPRLSSLKFALDVIPSGRPFNVKEGLENSVIDRVMIELFAELVNKIN